MIRILNKLLALAIIIISGNTLLFSQPYYPVTTLDNPAPGYIMTGPQSGTSISLVDNSGRGVFTKDIGQYGINPNTLRILENGNFAFFSSFNWVIMDAGMNVINTFASSPQYATDFHTLSVSSNGNYLLAAKDFITVDMSAKVEGGKTYARVLNIVIEEFDQQKNRVFSWNCFEHIDVCSATEDQNLTLSEIDPYHINTARYDFDGNIIANFRNLDAIIKINRATGAIMWIMGGSKCKLNQFTFTNDNQNGFVGFSHQHNPYRLPNGNLLLFDNAVLNPNKSSRAVEYSVNEQTKTVTKVWEYHHSPAIFSEFQGNAQRLPNGNTLIGWGVNYSNNLCTEITSDKKVIMEMSLGGNAYSYQVLKHIFMMNAASANIFNPRLYNFNEGFNNTNVALNVITITGAGSASVEKHNYGPRNVYFEGAQACSYLPYRWVLNYRGISSLKAKIYISLNQISNLEHKSDLKIYWRKNENSGSFKLLTTTYSPEYDRLEAEIDSYGEFIVGFSFNSPPKLQSPTNKSNDVVTNAVLDWSADLSNTKFVLQLSKSENFNNIILQKSLTEITQYQLESLDFNTKFFWRVKVEDNECDTKWSDVYSFTTEIEDVKLELPENKTNNQSLSGFLSCNQVNGANRYQFMLSEDSIFKEPKLVLDRNIDSNLINYSDLKPFKNYYWKVGAVKEGTIKKWSEIFTFKTNVSKVELLSPSDFENRLPVTVLLKWMLINSVEKWNIQISNEPDFHTTVLNIQVNSKNCEYSFSNLNFATNYYWRVRGVLGDTVTDWSDTWQFSTKISSPLPIIPSKNEGSDGLPVQSYITWEKVSGALRYQIQLSKDSEFYQIKFNAYSEDLNIWYDNLDFRTNYWCRIRAFDGEQFSDWSQLVELKTCSRQLFPKDNQFKIPILTDLMWNEGNNEKFYEIKIATDTNFTEGLQLFSPVSSNQLEVSKLDYAHKYFWSVRSFTSSYYTSWSEPFCFTTKLESPSLIYPDFDEVNNATNLNFKWSNSQDADFYKLEIASDIQFENLITNIENIETPHFVLLENMRDGVYWWRIASYNENNSSDWSVPKRFIVNSAMSVNGSVPDLSEYDIINFPNPLENETKFYITIKNTTPVCLKIYDLTGKEIFQIINETLPSGSYLYKWDALNVINGIYYYVISTNNSTSSGKLIIVK